MRKLTREQLLKVSVANLSNYDFSTETYHIPKLEYDRYEVDKCYIICLDDSLLTPTGNEILVANWNKGSYPPCKFMKIDVTTVYGKMIYVNAMGYDYYNQVNLNVLWQGWLPIQLIKIVERI